MDDQTSPDNDAGTESQGQAPPPGKSAGRSPLVIVAIVGSVLGMLGLVCAGMMAAVAIPDFIAMGSRAKRAEVPANVKGIRVALEVYNSESGGYVGTGIWPRPLQMLDKDPHAWSSDSAFDTLGWRPDGNVRGAYQVEVAPSGRDFIVHGWIDSDGDGVPAHYTATKSVNAVLVTPNDVY